MWQFNILDDVPIGFKEKGLRSCGLGG